MQHNQFHSKLGSSAERPSLLEGRVDHPVETLEDATPTAEPTTTDYQLATTKHIPAKLGQQ